MQLTSEPIFLLAGLLLGPISAWLIMTIRIRALRSEWTAASQIEIAELRERLRADQTALSQSQSRVQELEARKGELDLELRNVFQQLAAVSDGQRALSFARASVKNP